MLELKLPKFNYSLKTIGNKVYIFDIVRKKFVRLRPEEWVRQHFLHYMIDHLGFPAALISVEGQLSYHTKKLRSDIHAYSRLGEVLFIMECKAPGIHLSQEHVYQLLAYYSALKAPFLAISNGFDHMCWYRNTRKMELLPEVPGYSAMLHHLERDQGE
jgi:hypothetical protein